MRLRTSWMALCLLFCLSTVSPQASPGGLISTGSGPDRLAIRAADTGSARIGKALTSADAAGSPAGFDDDFEAAFYDCVESWSSHGPAGGVVYAMAIKPLSDSIVYAGGTGGIYQSSDAGQNWSLLNSQISPVWSVAVDPTATSTVYAGTDGSGLFKSTDDGQTWTALTNGLSATSSVWILAVNPQQSATVYAATGGGVYKTTNSGQSWTAKNVGLTNLNIYSFALDSLSPNTLYAGTSSSGVFKSTDGGQNWVAKITGLSNLSVYGLAVHPQTDNIVYAGTNGGGCFKSTNGGTNWTPKTTGLTDWDILYIVLDPQSPATIYAGTAGGGVFRSTNNGDNWASLPTGLPAGITVWSAAPGPAALPKVFIGTDGEGIYQSSDGGLHWDGTNFGYGLQTVIADPLNPAIAYAGAYGGGAAKSTDGGQSWNAINTGLLNTFLNCLVINPQSTGTLYAGTGGDGVFKSTNGGQNWAASNSGIADATIWSLAVDPATPATIYAGTSNAGVYRSTDSGQSWAARNSGISTAAVLSVALSGTGPTAVYAGTYGNGVYKSTDGGQNWAVKNNGLTNLNVYWLAADPHSPATLYAGTVGGGALKTTNGGDNWAEINLGLTNSWVFGLSVDPQTSNTVYAATVGDGVFKSVNAGQNWSPINTGLADPVVWSLAITAQNPPKLHAGTSTTVYSCATCPACTGPSISTHPQSAGITSGQTAALSVTATGSLPLAYQWYQGNSPTTTNPISGATNSGYTTPALTVTTSFWVKVSNTCGAANSNTATITVCQPPAISVHPQNKTIGSGQTTALSVTATGSAPLVYQWYQGSSPNTANPISGATNSGYTTPALTATASYWVRVTNGCGTANSNTATVTVTVCTGPAISSHPQSVSIGSGLTAALSVTATGTSPLAYQWYQGASPATTNPISGATNSSYTTPALTAAASFWVKVTNGCGTANSNTATVTVVACQTPSISAQPASQALSSGRTASLSVTATGTAPLSYQWYLGSSPSTASPIAGATGSGYTTPALTGSNNYWVKVTNGCGSANSATATITVLHQFLAAAAHTTGGTNWKSDVDLYNTGTTDAAVRIALLEKGKPNLNPTTTLVTVPAGKSLQLLDVLGSTFQVINAGLGFSTSSTSILVNSRFFNTVPAPSSGTMTFGMYVPSRIPSQSLRGDGVSRGMFHFLRYSTDVKTGFRTNIGFVNGSGFDVTVEITLFEDGVQLGNPVRMTLRAFEHQQITNIHTQVTAQNVAKGTAIVRVITANGEVHAYAMLIDNKSNDPICMSVEIR